MMSEPLTSPDCDCTDLDSFMLNVERLMASELVALSSHEVISAALFLWCRAWKQLPAASLPDDDRVLAAYARLPAKRFSRLKDEILRGFVKCSDGRLYHRVLAVEAMRAFAKKKAFQTKRATDAERLRKWRETHKETRDETRFVPEGTGTGRDRDGKNYNSDPNGSGAQAPLDAASIVFGHGREWLQRSTGKSDQHCRQLLGKWRKAIGDEALISVLGAAEREGPIDALGWIERALQQRKAVSRPVLQV
jgi:uncharacterized protein YdaU (DUF1376 family)